MKDLTGLKFSKLTVLSLNGSRRESRGRSRRMWNCKCECGAETIVAGNNLTNDHTASCGSKKHQKNYHGITNTPIYHVWENMLARCTSENHPSWKDYGGRGITVCERWMDFTAFHNDMAEGYKSGLTIERVDNNAGYAKENCRWATRLEQMLNQRSSILLRLNGVRIASGKISSALGFPARTIQTRLYNGWELFATVLCPVKSRVHSSP